LCKGLAMRNYSYLRWVIFAVAGLLVSCDQTSTENSTIASFADPGSTALVTPSWLSQQFQSPGLVILELGRTQDEYFLGHIPGAQFVDWRTDISDPALPDRYNLPPRSKFEALMSRLGVATESTLVLYDSMNSRAATRLFWILKYYNHADVKILDGGLDAWEAAGLGLVNEPEQATETEYVVSSVNDQYLVDIGYIINQMSDTSFNMVDGLSLIHI